MTRKDKILISIVLLLFVLMIFGESSRKNINWYPSFSTHHKIPFGTYVAHQEAEKIFGHALQDISTSPYVFLSKNKYAKGTYILYNQQVNLGETNLNALLEWVKNGNRMFISSENFDKNLLDSLHIKPGWYYNTTQVDRKLQLKLTSPKLQGQDSIIFDKIAYANIIRDLDSVSPKHQATVLGSFIDKKDKDLYNFVSFKYGKGKIFLHTFPYVFTNYFILKNNNADYFSGILSYINQKKPVYWDVHYQNSVGKKGALQYVFSNDAFRWSYRLFLIGLIFYIIFEGKRKQRAIPIVEPLKNETLSFTKTISDMYIVNKEHKRMASMHVNHFMDYLRTKLYLDTSEWNADLMHKIGEKTKTDIGDVKKLFNLMDIINKSDVVLAKQVLELDKLINEIKKAK